jgi:hypothetical protein
VWKRLQLTDLDPNTDHFRVRGRAATPGERGQGLAAGPFRAQPPQERAPRSRNEAQASARSLHFKYTSRILREETDLSQEARRKGLNVDVIEFKDRIQP